MKKLTDQVEDGISANPEYVYLGCFFSDFEMSDHAFYSKVFYMRRENEHIWVELYHWTPENGKSVYKILSVYRATKKDLIDFMRLKSFSIDEVIKFCSTPRGII